MSNEFAIAVCNNGGDHFPVFDWLPKEVGAGMTQVQTWIYFNGQFAWRQQDFIIPNDRWVILTCSVKSQLLVISNQQHMKY